MKQQAIPYTCTRCGSERVETYSIREDLENGQMHTGYGAKFKCNTVYESFHLSEDDWSQGWFFQCKPRNPEELQ